MAMGFRAYKEFERPAPELIEAFRGIPSSNIGDCTQRMNCMFDGIRPFNDLPLVGTAFTVRVPSGDNLVAQAALDYARPGDIIVIDAAGNTDRGMVGGMMLAYAEMRGLGGFVVNGAVRDLEDIQNGSLPVYGKAVSPLGPYRQGPGEMNVPVVCGGQVVMPGDILVGDRDGIVVIPRQEAAELLEAARKNLQDEQEAMARMKAGTFPVEEHLESFTGSLLRRGGDCPTRESSGTVTSKTAPCRTHVHRDDVALLQHPVARNAVDHDFVDGDAGAGREAPVTEERRFCSLRQDKFIYRLVDLFGRYARPYHFACQSTRCRGNFTGLAHNLQFALIFN